MESEGDDQDRGPEGTGATDADADADRLTRLLGGLLIELGEKVREAGPDGVRILTDEEVQHANVLWYRTGWEEHARAVQPSPEPTDPSALGYPAAPDSPPSAGRLLRFPQSPTDPPTPHPHPLPIVSAGEASVRELMPHRQRLGMAGRGRERARGRQSEGLEPVEAADGDE